ncbi:MAG: JAB domain-containing protein [Limisphaerales bacterium]
MSQGTLDTILVHPREVFKSAIAARAAAIVLVFTTIQAATRRHPRLTSRSRAI